MEIVTRVQARLFGKTRFYTGRPCRNGHDCERYVSMGGCVQCINGNKKTWKIERGSLVPETSARHHGFALQLPVDATPEQRADFVKWLQHSCVPAFFEPLGLRLGPPKSTT